MKTHLNLNKVIQDSRVFGSNSTAILYLRIVMDREPFVWGDINIQQLSRELNISNPYKHMRKIEDAGYIERSEVSLGGQGTLIQVMVDYRVGEQI